MRDGRHPDGELLAILRLVSPGTALYEALENILRARMGALIVVGDSPEVLDLANGGFQIDAEATPAAVYELSKMDGALILSRDARRILMANAHLTPNPSIPTQESGTRHRTAQRVARQTGELVVAISQRRNVITLYKGALRHVLRDVGVVLAKANQALATLERYKAVLVRTLAHLTALEFAGVATLYDVAFSLQRALMVERIAREIALYVAELGAEGRLVDMQLEELMGDVGQDGPLMVRDYLSRDEEDPEEVWEDLAALAHEELPDLPVIVRALGYSGASDNLDLTVTPRGYRILAKIPRLPGGVIHNLVQVFSTLPEIMTASLDELDDVEGIGEVRARAIQEGLRRLREQAQRDRQLA